MINSADLSGKLAIDANGLSNLKIAARDNSPEAIKAVAKQFEGIFMNMMLKSMRDASPQDGEFDSEQTRSFTAMLDQQLAQNLSSKGLGLAEVLAKQLSGQTAAPTVDSNSTKQAPKNGANQTDSNSLPSTPTISITNPLTGALQSTLPAQQTQKTNNDHVTKFQEKMLEHADNASRTSGIPSNLMMGQAALESGWGSREIRAKDGTTSHNLFGIKATSGWKGKVAEAVTTEYIDGVKQKRIEKFRAYDSYTESFQDFANMMKSNPRYNNVINNLDNPEAYAKALQQAGYATDPNYAAKLSAVIKRVTSS